MQNEYAYSDASKFLPGGIWSCAAADVVRNFPACKLLLHQDDIGATSATWVDRVTGLLLTATGVFTKGTYGVWGAVNTITGIMPAIADAFPLVQWEGRAAATSVTVGIGDTSTAAGLDLRGANTGYASASAVNYVSINSLAPSYPFDGLMSLYAKTDATNEVYKQFCNAANTAITTASKTGVDGGTGVNATFETLPSVMAIPAAATSGAKMLALFCFTNALSGAEVNTAMKWCAANPGKLYPGFAGRT